MPERPERKPPLSSNQILEEFTKQTSRRSEAYDVWYRFAADPQACVADADARALLRSLQHPLRAWFRYPSPEETEAARTAAEKRQLEEQRRRVHDDQGRRQSVPWWEDLRKELVSQAKVPERLADLFADYLSGYVMVRDREQTKIPGRHAREDIEEPAEIVVTSSGVDPGQPSFKLRPLKQSQQSAPEPRIRRVLPEWRQAKRRLRKLKFPPTPTTTSPGKQSLKTTLTSLMVRELQRHESSLAKSAKIVSSAWALVGEATDQSDPNSIARAERRARQRPKPADSTDEN